MTDLPFDPAEFASRLIAAHHDATRVQGISAPPAQEDAMSVQQIVMAELGPVAGYKTALRPDGKRIIAPIPACYRQDTGSTFRAPEGFDIGVELEVGFIVTQTPPDPASPDFEAALKKALRPVAVIEMVTCRLSEPLASDAWAKLADNQINGGLIVGDMQSDWDGSDIASVQANMQAGDASLVNGPAEVPGASALSSVMGLAREIGHHCGGLQTGQIVITGSLHPLTYVARGTNVQGHIEGIGDVAVMVG